MLTTNDVRYKYCLTGQPLQWDSKINSFLCEKNWQIKQRKRLNAAHTLSSIDPFRPLFGLYKNCKPEPVRYVPAWQMLHEMLTAAPACPYSNESKEEAGSSHSTFKFSIEISVSLGGCWMLYMLMSLTRTAALLHILGPNRPQATPT